MKFSRKTVALFDLAWKAGCIALLLLNIFLKTQFVAHEAYDKDRQEQRESDKQMQAAIVELKSIVATMEVKSEINQRQDGLIQDHENRLRAVENGKKR